MVVSMVIAGIIAFLTATSFAKLTAWQPVEGSVYEFGHQLISPYMGFLAGWMWLVSNTFTGAAVALGFAYYLNSALPSLPANLTAAVLVLAFTGLNLLGAKQSATVNNVLVTVKLVVLAFFVILGSLHFNAGNFTSFTPFSSGVLYGAFFIFFAYGGFARAAVVAEEVVDAKRNVPRAMLLSLGISMAIYVLVGLVAVGLLDAGVLAASGSPLSSAIGASGSSLAVQIVVVGSLVATASVLLTSILGVSRMAFAMARRGDLPAGLAHLHKKFLTPYWTITLTGVLMVLLVLFVDLKPVVVISTFALLFYYSTTNFAAYRLKEDKGFWRQTVLPLAAFVSCLLLLVFVLFASPQAWLVGVVFLVAGSVYYLVHKRRLLGKKLVGLR